MRNAFEAKIVEVGESLSRSCRIELRACTKSSKHGSNFQIDELGGGQPLVAQSVTSTLPLVAIVEQDRRHYGRVDDDHLVSRSARTARTASAALSLPPV